MLDISSPPEIPRASSSSPYVAETNRAESSMEGFSPLPLAIHPDDDRHRHSLPNQSLRQRGTSSAAPPRSSAALSVPVDDDESLSNSEDDESKGGNSPTPSVFRSILGASPFLMGPHMFSASEILQPPRACKEINDQIDLKSNLEMSPSSKINILFRRGAPQSMLASPSSSTRGSSFLDIASGEQRYSLDESAASSSVRSRLSSNFYRQNYAFLLRSRENVIIHFLIEAKMLKADWPILLFAIFYSFFHSTVTNVAYWQHAQLNAANRVPLQDIAFDILPVIDGDWWIASEYIVWSLVAVCFSCIAFSLIVKWNAPHGKPIYLVQIMRRMGLTLVVCQTLRMISFLVTTLPGASRQCRYAVPDGLTSAEMLSGPAPNEGNPSGWAPPTELHDILFRLDCSSGCGDLMFSSHTIYSMTFVCIVFKYFNFKWLKLYMALGQALIVPFILAARKHYTVDVFTALYVTPMVFEIISIRFPDRETSIDLAKYYGIHFYLAQEYHDSFSYVVSLWGKEFYVDPDELPSDVIQERHHVKSLALPTNKSGEDTGSAALIV